MANSFTHLALLITILVSGLFARAETSKSAFLTTTPVMTPKGLVYIEVQTYRINNPSDLITFRDHYLKNINKGTSEHFTLSFKTEDYKTNALHSESKNLFSYLTSVTKAKTIRKTRELVVASGDNVKKYYKENKLNLTLGIVRFFANGGVLATGLIKGAGVSPEHALVVGALAGGFSAAMQIKGEFFLNWLENSRKLVGLAQKYSLINKIPKKYRIRNISYKSIVGTETLGKWYAIELAFLGLIQSAMYAFDIPTKESLFITSGKSTLSQGVYETGINKAANALKNINPSWEPKLGTFKQVAFFSGSAISVVAAVGSLIGIPFSNLGFVVLTAGGAAFHLAPKIVAKKDALVRLFTGAKKPEDKPILIMSCQKLFTI